MNDVPFEAAFLRAALLVGLVHEQDVPAWATVVIANSSGPIRGVADVVGARVELSAMREALRPIGESVDQARVSAALLTAVSVDFAVGARNSADALRILGQIRQEWELPGPASAKIKEFQDRAMLAHVGMQGQSAPRLEELASWLDDVRAPGFFRFHFDDGDQMGAFVAALARKVERNRTWDDRPGRTRPQAWLLRQPDVHRAVVVLNESALMIVLREFSPVPLVSRIPYREPGALAVPVVDEATAWPLGPSSLP
jgi:hypothetical protein